MRTENCDKVAVLSIHETDTSLVVKGKCLWSTIPAFYRSKLRFLGLVPGALAGGPENLHSK